MSTSEEASLMDHDHLMKKKYHTNSPPLARPDTKGPGADIVSMNTLPVDVQTRPTRDRTFSDMSIDADDPQALLDTLEKAIFLLQRQTNEQEHQEDSSNKRLKPLLPPWLTRHLFLITFFLQVINIGVLEIFYAIKGLRSLNGTNSSTDKAIVYTSDGIMTAVEGVHLLVIVLVTFKLAKQVLHQTASGIFLAQCYLSTVLLFAGVYTLEYRLDKTGAWKNVIIGNDEIHPILVFLRMLYFSVSTATLCGTSTVEPVVWYAYMTVGVQMLLSFVYFASILSLSMLPRKKSKVDPTRKSRLKSFTGCIRQCFRYCCRKY